MSLHPVVCKHCLQYVDWPDERFWVQVGTWKLGSLSGTGGEDVRKRMIGVLFT